MKKLINIHKNSAKIANIINSCNTLEQLDVTLNWLKKLIRFHETELDSIELEYFRNLYITQLTFITKGTTAQQCFDIIKKHLRTSERENTGRKK